MCIQHYCFPISVAWHMSTYLSLSFLTIRNGISYTYYAKCICFPHKRNSLSPTRIPILLLAINSSKLLNENDCHCECACVRLYVHRKYCLRFMFTIHKVTYTKENLNSKKKKNIERWTDFVFCIAHVHQCIFVIL